MDIQQAVKYWNDFGSIPIGEDDDLIQEPFLHFPVGTSQFDIWYWLEEQCPEFSVGEATDGKYSKENST